MDTHGSCIYFKRGSYCSHYNHPDNPPKPIGHISNDPADWEACKDYRDKRKGFGIVTVHVTEFDIPETRWTEKGTLAKTFCDRCKCEVHDNDKVCPGCKGTIVRDENPKRFRHNGIYMVEVA